MVGRSCLSSSAWPKTRTRRSESMGYGKTSTDRKRSVKTYNILHLLQFLTMDIVEKMSVDKAPMVEKVTILEDRLTVLTHMCLSDSSNLLAVSASRIFANEWGGTLKVFKSSKDHAFVEAEEVALTAGNCASLIL